MLLQKLWDFYASLSKSRLQWRFYAVPNVTLELPQILAIAIWIMLIDNKAKTILMESKRALLVLGVNEMSEWKGFIKWIFYELFWFALFCFDSFVSDINSVLAERISRLPLPQPGEFFLLYSGNIRERSFFLAT